MKKLLIASAVTAGFLGSAAVQADTSAIFDNWQDRAYVVGKLGTADLGLDDNAMTVTGVAGLHTPSIHPALSFEADLTLSLTDAESSLPSSMGSTTIEASAFSMGAYAVASYDQFPVENLTPFARLGLAYSSVDVTAANSVVSVSGETSEFGIGFTGGVRYTFSDQLSAVADYTSVSEIDVLNIGVQYDF